MPSTCMPSIWYLNTNETTLPPFLSLYVSVASLITIGTLSTPTVSHRVRHTSKHNLLQTHIKRYEKIKKTDMPG